jgi:hypothetical protein
MPTRSLVWPGGLVASTLARLSHWWRNRVFVRDGIAQLSVDAEETQHIARDLCCNEQELFELARRGPDAADLLPQRMAALGLESVEVGRSDPVLLRDLQRLCALCDSKGRCMRDLASDPNDPIWEQYCPNEATLNGLKACGIGARPSHT